MKWLCPQCRKRFESPGDRCPEDGAPMVEDRAGESVGGCILEALIGVGRNRSTVWEASRGDEPRVAVKVVPVDDEHRRESLQAAARSAAVVRHANLVSIHGHGSTVDGHVYVVMDLLEGLSLASRLGRQTPFPAEEALDITGQILDALSAAHREGLPHLELEPADVFLEKSAEGPRVTVLDVGLAQPPPVRSPLDFDDETEPPEALHYRAPELSVSGRGDASSDLYAVGAILVHLLTGRHPYSGSAADLERAHLSRQPPQLAERGVEAAVADALQPVIDRLMAKQPVDRYPSAAEARMALLASLAPPAVGGPPAEHPAPTPPERAPAPPPASPVRGRSTGDRGAGPDSLGGASGPIDALPPEAPSGGARWPLVAVIVLLAGVGIYLATRPPAVAPPAADASVATAVIDRGPPPPPPPRPPDAAVVDATPKKAPDAAVVDAVVDAAGPRESTITSTPAGAMVLADGVGLGETPWTGVVPAGTRALVLQLDGHADHAFDLEADAVARGGLTRSATLEKKPSRADAESARRWLEKKRATEAAQARALEAAKETARRLEEERAGKQPEKPPTDAPAVAVDVVPEKPPAAATPAAETGSGGVLRLDRQPEGRTGRQDKGKGKRTITTLGDDGPGGGDEGDGKKVDLLK